jgi:hypothetical protein
MIGDRGEKQFTVGGSGEERSFDSRCSLPAGAGASRMSIHCRMLSLQFTVKRTAEKNSEMERMVIPERGDSPPVFVSRGNKGLTGGIVVSMGNIGVSRSLARKKRRKNKEMREK